MNADAQAPAGNPHALDANDGTIWAGGDAGLRRITALVEAPKPLCPYRIKGESFQHAELRFN